MQGIKKGLLGFIACLSLSSMSAHANSLYTKPCDPLVSVSKKHCWFLGAGFGASSVSPVPVDNSLWRVDSSGGSSFKLYFGHTVSNHIFTEFSYENLGSASLKNLNPNVTPNTDSINYQAISFNGGYWLRGRQSAWDVYAKAGLGHLITGGDEDYVFQDHAVQLVFSAGAELRFLNQWVGRFEFTSYDQDASSFGLSISRHLGPKPKYTPPTKVAFTPKPKSKIEFSPKPKQKPKPKSGPAPKIDFQVKPKPQPKIVVPPKPTPVVPTKAPTKAPAKVPTRVPPKPEPKPVPKPAAPPKPEPKIDTDTTRVIDDSEWATKDRTIPKRSGASLLPRASDRDADGVRNNQDRCPKTPPNTEVDDSGCMVLLRKVLAIKFDANRAVVKDMYADELQKLAKHIKTLGRVHIRVEAHSDRDDQEIDSQLLSELRAAVVADLLIIKTGIPNESFTMRGLTDGGDEERQSSAKRQSKQRVEVIVSKR